MPDVRRSRAFTLIEAMVVVVLIGVLAVLASVAYRRWIRSSYLGEAHGMLANIRTAEEAFRAENSGYLPVSAALTALYPDAMPTEKTVTQWGGGADAAKWAALNVNPNAPVRFGYAVLANNDLMTAPPAVSNNGAAVNLASLTGQPWFVATAVCDIDNDSSNAPTTLFAISGSNVIMVNNEGQ
jgi:prepilin-type N-terminal cleavage/methylation domain-containing protein